MTVSGANHRGIAYECHTMRYDGLNRLHYAKRFPDSAKYKIWVVGSLTAVKNRSAQVFGSSRLSQNFSIDSMHWRYP